MENQVRMESENSCEPKDLSLKCKKLKPIPPPLDLKTNGVDSNDTLKEFANFATSPKSPLMQKNLPFRKRAYSFSGLNDPSTVPVKTTSGQMQMSDGNSQNAQQMPTSSDSSGNENSSSKTSRTSPSKCRVPSPSVHTSDLNRYLNSYKLPHTPTSPAAWTVSGNPGFFSPRPAPSPNPVMYPTSALLSPAPSQPSSSLGSSREELNSSPAATGFTDLLQPWAAPVWNCFLTGTRILYEDCDSVGGWLRVEDLAQAENEKLEFQQLSNLGPLCIDRIEHVQQDTDVALPRVWVRFVLDNPCTEHFVPEAFIAECASSHPFLVKDKGWCAAHPDQLALQYGVPCRLLEKGDICLTPHKHPLVSPDICERFKRFCFPLEEPSLHRPVTSPLSPPTSPTKKARNVDPDRPKRPMNGFMLYAKEHRIELIQMHPGKDNRAISVLLGEAWRQLPGGEKERYVHEARSLAQEQKRLHPDCWKRKRSQSTS